MLQAASFLLYLLANGPGARFKPAEYAEHRPTEPVGHIVVFGSPAPVQVRVAVDSLEMLCAHVEHSADQLFIRQPVVYNNDCM